jgi:hypothetical protein
MQEVVEAEHLVLQLVQQVVLVVGVQQVHHSHPTLLVTTDQQTQVAVAVQQVMVALMLLLVMAVQELLLFAIQKHK